MNGSVDRFDLGLGEQEVDAAECDQGCGFDGEAGREGEGGDYGRGGVEVEVLWPGAIEVRVLGVVGRGADVGEEGT